MDSFVVRRLSMVSEQESWGVYERTPSRLIKLVSKHPSRRQAREVKDQLLQKAHDREAIGLGPTEGIRRGRAKK